MQYCLRLLTNLGRKLGAFRFDSHADHAAIAAAMRHEADGPVDVWADCDNAAWLLYRSRFVDVSAQHAERVVLPFPRDPRWARSHKRRA